MKVLSIILMLAGVVDVFIAEALKVMHWPGINYMRYGGIISLSLGIFLFVFARRRSGQKDNN